MFVVSHFGSNNLTCFVFTADFEVHLFADYDDYYVYEQDYQLLYCSTGAGYKETIGPFEECCWLDPLTISCKKGPHRCDRFCSGIPTTDCICEIGLPEHQEQDDSE